MKYSLLLALLIEAVSNFTKSRVGHNPADN